MIDTKLILMEGLPSTGKSTNSGILFSQLERNGEKVRWVHEVARPHPTLFFHEAYLEEEEYKNLINLFPETELILNKIKTTRNSSVVFDLLELEWNYSEQLNKNVINELEKSDVWNFAIDRYKKVAIEKWENFVKKQKLSDEIVILDSSIFQFQIYTLILADVPLKELQEFIEALYNIISPLNPSLVYLYRENTESTIEFLIKDRGNAFLERIWERDKDQPYYKNRPNGVDGYKMFLRDYGKYAKLLFDSFPFQKLPLEITQGKWEEYVNQLMKFLDIEYIHPPNGTYPTGKYYNEKLNKYLEVIDNICHTPDGGKKRLIAKSETEFYILDIPVILRATEDSLIIEGEQLCDQWTTKGTLYKKL